MFAVRKTATLLASIALSLALAEAAASLLHHRAFPFLNLFERSQRFGVVLAPSSSARIRSRLGRVTEVRTNSLGFRGPEWPEHPRATRVLLVGDSQVLGYNVAFADSMSAQLATLLDADVMPLAVPSWGPPEYAMAVAEWAPRLHPTHVVFVANAANDWFETTVPNARRTTTIDGWAARWFPGMPQPRWFPGRELLLRHSHLALAARELWEHHASQGGELAPSDAAAMLVRDVDRLRSRRDDDDVGAGPGTRSRLAPALRATAAACRPHDCLVVAAALPLDVQVSRDEWRKYRSTPLDLTRTQPLLDDFVEDARALGLPAVNLLQPLRAASPGAFLPDDYHLSPRGHRVVAEAIAASILSTRSTAEARP